MPGINLKPSPQRSPVPLSHQSGCRSPAQGSDKATNRRVQRLDQRAHEPSQSAGLQWVKGAILGTSKPLNTQLTRKTVIMVNRKYAQRSVLPRARRRSLMDCLGVAVGIVWTLLTNASRWVLREACMRSRSHQLQPSTSLDRASSFIIHQRVARTFQVILVNMPHALRKATAPMGEL